MGNSQVNRSMLDHIKSFFASVGSGEIEIYNEFSLQHELGAYLRRHVMGAKIQFERTVSFFGLHRAQFLKKEIDISIFATPQQPNFAIELKYPRAGQHPEQMFKACQDIVFLEQLVSAGFGRGYFIMAAEDPLFYRREVIDGIYSFFRGDTPIAGQIFGPTGDRTRAVTVSQRYQVQWQPVKDLLQYLVIEIQRESQPVPLQNSAQLIPNFGQGSAPR